MVDQTIKSLGLDVVVSVPSTPEEFASLGGDVMKEAVNNVLYRSYLAELRDRFCERVSAFTEIKRKTKQGAKKKDGTFGQDVWDESEGRFLDRVLAETETEIDAYADLMKEAQAGGYTPTGEIATIEALVFDPKKSEPNSGPKVPAKTYLNAAQQIIDAGNADKVAANLSKIVGREITADKESIAGGIRDAENLEKKQLANKYA